VALLAAHRGELGQTVELVSGRLPSSLVRVTSSSRVSLVALSLHELLGGQRDDLGVEASGSLPAAVRCCDSSAYSSCASRVM